MKDLVEDFLKFIQIEKKFSPHTIEAYKNDLSGFGQYLHLQYESIAISEANHLQIRSWIVSLSKEKYTSVSINRKISTLRTFYKWLIKRNFIAQNPMLKIVAPKKQKRLPVTINDSALNFLFEQAIPINTDYESVRNSFIISLLYATGIRRAELVSLDIGDINCTKSEIRVIGKGNKERIIPVSDKVLHDFDTYYKIRHETHGLDDGPFFLTKSGQRIYPRLVHEIVKNALNNITTLEKKSPHILRHSMATHLLNNGAELNAIKEILGHANLAATQIYTHNSITKLKEAYGKAHPRS